MLLFEYLDVRDRIAAADGSGATAAVGGGVWIAAIGALLAVAATASILISDRPRVAHIRGIAGTAGQQPGNG